MKSEDMKRLPALLDYFFVLRPMLFFPGWSTLLAGYFIVHRDKFFSPYYDQMQLNYIFIFKLMIVFAAAMGAAFLLNQLKDVESDRKNRKLFIVASGSISFNEALIEVIVLTAGAVWLAWEISYLVGALVLLFIFVTGYLYNYPPFSFKDRPWLSLLSNSMMGWLAFAIGWASQAGISYHIFLDSLPYLFFNSALYFYTTLPDIAGDHKSGKNTLAVKYGLNTILYAAFILYILSLVSAVSLNDYQAMMFILPALPFFAVTLHKKDITSAVWATKFSILFFALVVCLKFTAYLAIMVVLFFFTRWYFRQRFNYDYPNFKSK